MIALKVDQNPFEPRQPTGMDPDPFAHFQIRPRLARNLRSNRQLNGRNFPILDRYGRSAEAHDPQNSRGFYRRTSLRVLESAKDVSRKKRLFDFFLSV